MLATEGWAEAKLVVEAASRHDLLVSGWIVRTKQRVVDVLNVRAQWRWSNCTDDADAVSLR